MPGKQEENADHGTLSERLNHYRLEAQQIVAAGAEHPRWELTRQASLNKNQIEERADFVKLVQGIANAHLREERVLVIGADQENRVFQAVTNTTEFDPARVSDVLERYLSPKPALEVFNSLQTDEGIPFVLLVFAPQQPRPVVGSSGIQDGKGNNLFRKGEIWVKEGTGLRIAAPEDISAMVEERIQSEADSRARKQFSQLRYEIVAAQQLITTSGRRSPAADLVYGRDEDFRLYVEDLLANDDSSRFSMLIELLRDLIIEGWNLVDAYSPGALDAEKLHSQLNDHKNTQFLPAFRRLTEIGLLLIKHRAEDEWFEQVGDLVEGSYVGQGMVALESMLTARTLAAYAIKRKLYQFVSTLLKVVVPIIGAYKELKQSLLLWPLRLGILMPEGVISFCWNNRISTSYKSFFGNWEDFLRPACQLEFILEINSYLGVGEAGPKPKAWFDKYRPDMVFNYVPDHLRYELSVCRPVAEEIYEALKRGPDDWTFVFLSIEKSLFDVVLKGENESQNPFFIAKFLKYLQKYQAQQFPLRFYLQPGIWGNKLTPLLAQLDAAGQQTKPS